MFPSEIEEVMEDGKAIRKFNPASISPITEFLILFCFAYFSYFLATVYSWNNAIAIIFFGIAFKHYGWYNLTLKGMVTSRLIFII